MPGARPAAPREPINMGVQAAGSLREEDVLGALRAVNDPDLHRDIVSLGFIKNLKIAGSNVALDIELTTPACPVRDRMKDEAETALRALPGVESVHVTMTAQVRKAAVSP